MGWNISDFRGSVVISGEMKGPRGGIRERERSAEKSRRWTIGPTLDDATGRLREVRGVWRCEDVCVWVGENGISRSGLGFDKVWLWLGLGSNPIPQPFSKMLLNVQRAYILGF